MWYNNFHWRRVWLYFESIIRSIRHSGFPSTMSGGGGCSRPSKVLGLPVPVLKCENRVNTNRSWEVKGKEWLGNNRKWANLLLGELARCPVGTYVVGTYVHAITYTERRGVYMLPVCVFVHSALNIFRASSKELWISSKLMTRCLARRFITSVSDRRRFVGPICGWQKRIRSW